MLLTIVGNAADYSQHQEMCACLLEFTSGTTASEAASSETSTAEATASESATAETSTHEDSSTERSASSAVVMIVLIVYALFLTHAVATV